MVNYSSGEEESGGNPELPRNCKRVPLRANASEARVSETKTSVCHSGSFREKAR